MFIQQALLVAAAILMKTQLLILVEGNPAILPPPLCNPLTFLPYQEARILNAQTCTHNAIHFGTRFLPTKGPVGPVCAAITTSMPMLPDHGTTVLAPYTVYDGVFLSGYKYTTNLNCAKVTSAEGCGAACVHNSTCVGWAFDVGSGVCYNAHGVVGQGHLGLIPDICKGKFVAGAVNGKRVTFSCGYQPGPLPSQCGGANVSVIANEWGYNSKCEKITPPKSGDTKRPTGSTTVPSQTISKAVTTTSTTIPTQTFSKTVTTTKILSTRTVHSTPVTGPTSTTTPSATTAKENPTGHSVVVVTSTTSDSKTLPTNTVSVMQSPTDNKDKSTSTTSHTKSTATNTVIIKADVGGVSNDAHVVSSSTLIVMLLVVSASLLINTV